MLERLTDAARQVIVTAQNEAVERGDNHIGSEYLALGLILAEEEEAAPRALTAAGVTAQMFRGALVDPPDKGAESAEEDEVPKASLQQVPFTPRAKRILELSLREALSLGHNYIGTEHILLSFVRENEGTGVQLLENLNVDLLEARQRVMEGFQYGVSPRREPLQALEWHLQRAKEQPSLIVDRLPKDDAFRRGEMRAIGRDIQKVEERLKKFRDAEE